MTKQAPQAGAVPGVKRSRVCLTCGNDGDWFPCILAGHDVPAPTMRRAWGLVLSEVEDGQFHVAWRIVQKVAASADCSTRTVENLCYWGIRLGYLDREVSMRKTPSGKVRKVKMIRKAEQT